MTIDVEGMLWVAMYNGWKVSLCSSFLTAKWECQVHALRVECMGLSVKASATWGECLNYQGGALVRIRCRAPLGSLDTLPRLPLPLNQDGGSSIEAYKSRKSHGKIRDCEQSTAYVGKIVPLDLSTRLYPGLRGSLTLFDSFWQRAPAKD